MWLSEQFRKPAARLQKSVISPQQRPAGRLQDHLHLEAVEDFTADRDLLSSSRDKPQR